MSCDRAIVQEEWIWRDSRDGAYVFGSHAAAEIQAGKMQYEIAGVEGTHLPVAVVCGSPQLTAERETRQRSREAVIEASVQRFKVSPEEAFADLERRHLA